MLRFHENSWVQEQKLTATGARAGDQFGFSASVSGDTVVVGAPGEECAAGAWCGSAYVFRFNGISWHQEQKLIASDAEQGFFGSSVSISGDRVVVGVPLSNCATGLYCGSAYLFRFNGISWIEEQKLTASDADDRDVFGVSVSLSGETVMVGEYAFRFNGTAWVEEQKLVASDGRADDEFGVAASVSGDTTVVGSPLDNCEAGTRCGSAYVFRFNGTSWVEEQKLTAADGRTNDQFGSSVSVSGDMVVVGAIFEDCAAGHNCGSAYLFRFNGSSWELEQELIASDAAAGDRFARSVALSGETVLVGSHWDDCDSLQGTNCGSAYVFSCVASPTGVNLDIRPGACPNKVNPRSRGVVPVAIVGRLDFDVATVDPDSLSLSRADGVGTSVSPLSERGGRGIVIKDVATPFDGEPCACHDADRDGIDDLAMKFSTSEMSHAFELNGLPRGTTIELVLQGTLQDGTMFEGADCIVIPGSEPTSNRRHHIRRPK